MNNRAVNNDDGDWTPQLEPREGREYKWGRDGQTGHLTIWEISGPGDGLPTHDEQLSKDWGRPDHYRPGDILGTAFISDDTVHITIYGADSQSAQPPEQLLAWTHTNYPGLPVRHNGTNRPHSR